MEAAVLHRNKIRLELSESITDLDDGYQRLPGPVVAEEDRDGIEGITKKPRQREQADAVRLFVEPLAFQKDPDVLADAAAGELEVIFLP